MEHKSVNPSAGSSSAVPVSEWLQEVRHREVCRWETSPGLMETDRGRDKVRVALKVFINFWHEQPLSLKKKWLLYLQLYKKV